jgi:hypothetical protein
MKKHPKVWVGFTGKTCAGLASLVKPMDDAFTWHRYRPDTGNEAARALNATLSGGWLIGMPPFAKITNIIQSQGIRVRWDVRKGRFI